MATDTRTNAQKVVDALYAFENYGQSPVADGGAPAPTNQPAYQAAPSPADQLDKQTQQLNNAGGSNFLMNVTQTQILTVTAIILGVLGIIYLARK